MKSNSVMTVRRDGGRLVFDFRGAPTLALNVAGLAESVREEGLFHGLKQKCVDAAAIGRNPTTGKSASVEDKRNAVARVIDMLERGLWTERKAVERRSDKNALLVQALAEVLGQPESAIIEKIRRYRPAQLAALRVSERVRPVLQRLENEISVQEDSDSILAELEGGEGAEADPDPDGLEEEFDEEEEEGDGDGLEELPEWMRTGGIEQVI